jgi:predicted N-acetyltransferase YhbS
MPAPTQRGVREEAPVTYRPPTAADVPAVARVVYEAFKGIAQTRGYEPDFPSVEAATGMAAMCVNHPAIFGMVAEAGGRIIGSNFLDERDAIRAVGPITVDPAAQARGVGRRLMETVIERWRDAGAPGIRLVQDAFNGVSISLYTSLGFDAKEPLMLMRGRPRSAPSGAGGGVVRPMEERDIEWCGALCRKVHRFHRMGELKDALAHFSPMVLERGGAVCAYASSPWMWFMNHAVAETEEDLCELVAGMGAANPQKPLEMLVPIRRAGFFRWLLADGVRVVKPMTLMAMGDYYEPDGAFLPSVAY